MISLLETRPVEAKVVNLSWERIYLTIDIAIKINDDRFKDKELDFYLVNGLYKAKVKLKEVAKNGNVYSMLTNITNNGENRCIPIGTYSIYICDGEEYKLADCEVSEELVPRLEDCSRNFLYRGKGAVYTVTFYVEEGGDTLPFRMYALSLGRNGMSFPGTPKILEAFKPFPNFKSVIFNKRAFLRRLYNFHAKKKRTGKPVVMFMTEQSDVIGSNLKAVADRMYERGMDKDFEIMFSARAAAAQPQSHKSWIKLVKNLAKCDMLFVDDHAPVLDWIPLKKTTSVFQTWHAGAGFKSSGYSRWGHIGCPAPVSAHRQYTYGIAGSKSIAPFFAEVWGINEERVLPTGMPRMDEYLDESYRKSKTEEIYNQFPMLKDKKVILFAPTYRGKNKKEAYYPYDLIDFDKLYELCNDEYVVMFKMHPWVSEPVPVKEEHMDKFVDVGTYPNINDLFYVTDLLITDYSSNIFEYSLMRKPMLFFAFDKIQYSFSRGFHRDYELSAPGKVCYTFDELLKAIEEKDFEYQKVDEYVEHHFDFIDSGASDRVIDWLVLGNIPEDIKEEIEARNVENEIMNSLDFTPELIGEASEEEEENN